MRVRDSLGEREGGGSKEAPVGVGKRTVSSVWEGLLLGMGELAGYRYVSIVEVCGGAPDSDPGICLDEGETDDEDDSLEGEVFENAGSPEVRVTWKYNKVKFN